MRAPVSRPHPPLAGWPAIGERPPVGVLGPLGRLPFSGVLGGGLPDWIGLGAGLAAWDAGGELERADLARDERWPCEGVDSRSQRTWASRRGGQLHQRALSP